MWHDMSSCRHASSRALSSPSGRRAATRDRNVSNRWEKGPWPKSWHKPAFVRGHRVSKSRRAPPPVWDVLETWLQFHRRHRASHIGALSFHLLA